MLRAKTLLLEIDRRVGCGSVSLKKLQRPEVVQVDDARHSPRAVEYDHRSNLALLHQPQCGAGKFLRRNRHGIGGHALFGRELENRAAPLLHRRRKSPSVIIPASVPLVSTTVVIPKPLRLIS